MTDEEIRERLDKLQHRCDKLAEWEAVLILLSFIAISMVLGFIWIARLLH